MVKKFLSFLLIFFTLSVFSLAKVDVDEEEHLKNEYGNDLTHVPFFLRFDFYKKYNKDWKNTYYYERHAYLNDYEISVAAQKAKEKDEARLDALAQQQKLAEDKEAAQKEKDRLKARADKKKQEDKAEADRQKDFKTSLKEQNQDLQDMKNDLEHQMENARNHR